MNRRFFIVAISFLLLNGCSDDADQDRAASDQMVLETGREISAETFRTLSSRLNQAIEEDGIAHALEFCSVEAMPLTEELSERYNTEIRRATHKARNRQNLADEEESGVIRTYIETMVTGVELIPKIYRKNDYIRYYAPIQVSMNLCLQCHGSPGTDINEENLAVIRSLYPDDEATGFSMGDIRGIWSITLPADSVSVQKILDRFQ